MNMKILLSSEHIQSILNFLFIVCDMILIYNLLLLLNWFDALLIQRIFRNWNTFRNIPVA